MFAKRRSAGARLFGLALAILGTAMPSRPTPAGTIYYQYATSEQYSYQFCSISDTGANPVVLGAAGSQSAQFSAVAVSGKTYGTVPGTTIPAPRFLTLVPVTQPPTNLTPSELGYFTPDGKGGMTWTQLTNFAANGWLLPTGDLSPPQFSNDGQDSFVSAFIVDQTVSPQICRLVRIHVTGADPAGVLVTPADPRVEVVLTLPNTYTGAGYNASALHAWDTSGNQLAYIGTGAVLNSNGTLNHTKQELRLRNVATDAEVVLTDTDKLGTGFFNLSWSPQPGSTILSFNDISVINTSTLAITKLITSVTFDDVLGSPIWSPDGTSFAMLYATVAGYDYSVGNYYTVSNVGKASATTPTPFSKVTKVTRFTKKIPYLTITTLGWR